MTWKIVGTMGFLESILFFRRTVSHWLTIRGGEFGRISSNSRFSSRILSGGLISVMMGSYGI
jgi:hypothetical protein